MVLFLFEGTTPDLVSSNAIACAMKVDKTMLPEQKFLVNCSGRGDKDIDYVLSRIEI